MQCCGGCPLSTRVLARLVSCRAEPGCAPITRHVPPAACGVCLPPRTHVVDKRVTALPTQTESKACAPRRAARVANDMPGRPLSPVWARCARRHVHLRGASGSRSSSTAPAALPNRSGARNRRPCCHLPACRKSSESKTGVPPTGRQASSPSAAALVLPHPAVTPSARGWSVDNSSLPAN